MSARGTVETSENLAELRDLQVDVVDMSLGNEPELAEAQRDGLVKLIDQRITFLEQVEKNWDDGQKEALHDWDGSWRSEMLQVGILQQGGVSTAAPALKQEKAAYLMKAKARYEELYLRNGGDVAEAERFIGLANAIWDANELMGGAGKLDEATARAYGGEDEYARQDDVDHKALNAAFASLDDAIRALSMSGDLKGATEEQIITRLLPTEFGSLLRYEREHEETKGMFSRYETREHLERKLRRGVRQADDLDGGRPDAPHRPPAPGAYPVPGPAGRP